MDLTGQRYGRLVVEARGENAPGRGQARWACRCDCGGEKLVYATALRAGLTTSCGCVHAEVTSARRKSHGLSTQRIYRRWRGMINRCENPSVRGYQYYGGRGITVCPQWHGPAGLEQFLADIGPQPSDPPGWTSRNSYYSIDRIDVDGDYEPGNVRWATPAEQALNKRPRKRDA